MLHGNIILDSVHVLEELQQDMPNVSHQYYRSVGAIGNVGRALKILDIGVHFDGTVGLDSAGIECAESLMQTGYTRLNYVDTATTVATILLERDKKTSIVQWGACQTLKQLQNIGVDWHHFAYLDALPHITPMALSHLKGTISADLCRQNYTDADRKHVLQFLPLLDFLIISCEEALALTGQEMMQSVRTLGSQTRGWAVLHDAAGSIASNGKTTFTSNLKKQPYVNVLGAGDYFASGFIASKSNGIFGKLIDGHIMAETLLND